MQDPKALSEFAVEFLETQGASVVGISTCETLAGGPPSTDLEYVLPGARSAVTVSAPRPSVAGGFHHPAMPPNRKINFTCGNCQLICHPDRDERKRRYKLLTKSGVVIQHDDGSLEALAPDIAEKYVSELPNDKRAMYVKD